MRHRVLLAVLGVALPLAAVMMAECSFAQGPCTPVLGVTPDTLDFGEVPLNQAVALGLLLFDDEPGSSPGFCGVMINGILLESGGDAFQLHNLPSFPIQIPVNGSWLIRVRFAPNHLGLHTGSALAFWESREGFEMTRVPFFGKGVAVTTTETRTWGSIKGLFR